MNSTATPLKGSEQNTPRPTEVVTFRSNHGGTRTWSHGSLDSI